MGTNHTGPIVHASRLRKIYRGAGEVEALQGLDLEVARGEMVAVVGPSGSGKTTLLNCLSGLDDFDSGTVTIDAVDLARVVRMRDGRIDSAAKELIGLAR